jgi:hypothetical protein
MSDVLHISNFLATEGKSIFLGLAVGSLFGALVLSGVMQHFPAYGTNRG